MSDELPPLAMLKAMCDARGIRPAGCAVRQMFADDYLRALAAWDACLCGRCGTALGLDAAVVLYKRYPYDGALYAWCVDCYSGSLTPPAPCEVCSRPVRYPVNLQRGNNRHVVHVICCQVCKRRGEALRASERKRFARSRLRCRACWKTFPGTRADARYCSPACRQKAYRRAVTDRRGCASGTPE